MLIFAEMFHRRVSDLSLRWTVLAVKNTLAQGVGVRSKSTSAVAVKSLGSELFGE